MGSSCGAQVVAMRSKIAFPNRDPQYIDSAGVPSGAWQSLLDLQAELQEDHLDFEKAVLELEQKMADWTPLVHGPRDYMLAAAAAGHRLRFCAVKKGGQQMKYISQEFDLRNQLHRLQVLAHLLSGCFCRQVHLVNVGISCVHCQVISVLTACVLASPFTKQHMNFR